MEENLRGRAIPSLSARRAWTRLEKKICNSERMRGGGWEERWQRAVNEARCYRVARSWLRQVCTALPGTNGTLLRLFLFVLAKRIIVNFVSSSLQGPRGKKGRINVVAESVDPAGPVGCGEVRGGGCLDGVPRGG